MYLHCHAFRSHHKTSKLLNIPLILNIPFLRKHQYFEEKKVFMWSVWKNHFCPYQKITKFNKYSTICPKISTFQEKLRYFVVIFIKSFFGPYFRKYLNSRKKYFSLDLFEKIVFIPYVQKYQYFEENYVFLDYFEKMVF